MAVLPMSPEHPGTATTLSVLPVGRPSRSPLARWTSSCVISLFPPTTPLLGTTSKSSGYAPVADRSTEFLIDTLSHVEYRFATHGWSEAWRCPPGLSDHPQRGVNRSDVWKTSTSRQVRAVSFDVPVRPYADLGTWRNSRRPVDSGDNRCIPSLCTTRGASRRSWSR